MYLKVVDEFNDFQVYAFVTASRWVSALIRVNMNERYNDLHWALLSVVPSSCCSMSLIRVNRNIPR